MLKLNSVKKAQGLPITTVVLIVIILVTLVAVAIFFFSGFDRSSKQVNPGIAIAECQSRCNRAKAIAPYEKDVTKIRTDSEFCTDYKCDDYVDCRVTPKNAKAQTLTC